MGNHRALLVANSKFYEDPEHLPELNAPVYDMARLQEALIHPTIGVFGRKQVKLLPNARCADVLLSIEGFFLECEPEDTLLLYYSGHGKLDINNNFFLCAADTRLDRLVSTAIRDEQVNAMMRTSPARSFILVLDCCSSGGWKSAAELLPDPLTGTGRFLITSSRAGQNSTDAAVVTESSPFTKYLVEAMAEADVDVDDDGFVDIDEIYKYVERNLKQSGQQAQRDFDKSAGSVALARRPKKRIEVVPKPIPKIGSEQPPSLSVVPERIEVTGVRPEDLPVIERIYVFNRGGGVLHWEADSDDVWIGLEPLDDFVRVSLAPTVAGPSRGTVYVRERDGAVERVPVQVLLEEGRTPLWTRLRASLVGSGWTRAKTMVVGAVAFVVAMALAIAAIVDPTPPGPDSGGGTPPPTEMVFEWSAETIEGTGAPPEVVNGLSPAGGRVVAAGMRGSKAATWVLLDGSWQAVPIPSGAPRGQVINGIPPFAGRFLAVGASQGDRLDAAAWWVSLDGELNPTGAFELPGDQIINKAFPLSQGLIAVGQDGGNGAVWFSEDGDDWILEPDDAGELGGEGQQVLSRVMRFTTVDGVQKLIAVGHEKNGSDEDGAVWIGEDPSTWHRVEDDVFKGDGEQRIVDVDADPDGGAVAVGYADSGDGDLDAAVWASQDGEHWERRGSDLLGGPGDQKIGRVLLPKPGSGLPSFIAAGSDTSSGTLDAALWYSFDRETVKKQTSVGTPLGGEGKQEILGLLVRSPGILAVGYDSRSGGQVAAIWYGE